MKYILVMLAALLISNQAIAMDDMSLPYMLKQLNLTTEQYDSLAMLKTQRQNNITMVLSRLKEIRQALDTELNQAQPDLTKVNYLIEENIVELQVVLKETRAERLKFYQTLNPEQKAIVHKFIKAKLDRLDELKALLNF